MNAKKIILILLASIVTLGASASEPLTTTYTNTIETKDGSVKEYTLFKTDTKEPLKKSSFSYDLNGNILEKVVYTWQGKNKGWEESQKLSYTYDESKSNKPVSLTLFVWDKKDKKWTNSKMMDYSSIEKQ